MQDDRGKRMQDDTVRAPQITSASARPISVERVRFKITATRTAEREIKRFSDILLIDRLHDRGQITERQWLAACRLHGLYVAAGLIPRVTGRLDVAPDEAEPEAWDEAVEAPEDARDVYRRLLRDAGSIHAHWLGELMAETHPDWRLPQCQAALDWLADEWGFERRA